MPKKNPYKKMHAAKIPVGSTIILGGIECRVVLNESSYASTSRRHIIVLPKKKVVDDIADRFSFMLPGHRKLLVKTPK